MLKFVTSCKYLGHVICIDISGDTEMQAKVKLICAKSIMLRQQTFVHLLYRSIY